MSELVMACDPGGRSGWAEAHMDVDIFELGESGVLPMRDMGLWLAEQQGVFYMGNPTRWEHARRRWEKLICESWRPFPRNGGMEWIQGSNLIYAQHVGQVRLVATLSEAEVVMQEPRDKYRTVNGHRELPPPGYPAALLDIDALSSEQHDQDARYHLWVYFFRNWFTSTVDPDACVVT